MYAKDDYTVVTNGTNPISIRRSDGVCIPISPGNRDYDEFLSIDGDNKACARVTQTMTTPGVTLDERIATLETLVASLQGV